MRKRIHKKVKPLVPRAITIKLHGSTLPSVHLTNLRAPHPLEHAEPLGPERMPMPQPHAGQKEEAPMPVQPSRRVALPKVSPAVALRRGASAVYGYGIEQVDAARQQLRRFAQTLVTAGAPIRGLASFLVMALVLIAPIPALSFYERLHAQGEQVIERGSQSVAAMTDGSTRLAAGDFLGASKAFSQSLAALSQISAELEHLEQVVSLLPSKGRAAAAKQTPQLVDGTRSLSLALLNVSTGLNTLRANESLSLSPLETMEQVNDVLRVAYPRVQEAANAFTNLEPADFPQPYRGHITALQNNVPLLAADLKKIIGVNELLANVLGEDHFRRYLVLFQNDAELRPTGGFMGSLALLDIDRGRIKNLEIPGGGPYDFTFSSDYVKPPQPLLLVNDRWELQDANWFPDFAASAQNVMRFWEEAHGPTVDGVLAINASLVEDVLRSLPPIELADYGVSVNAKNFRSVTQEQVDLLYDREKNTPKQFVADMAPELLQALGRQKDPRAVVQLVLSLSQGLLNHDVQLYFTDPQLQSAAADLGIDGGMVQTDNVTDYLMVVNTNLGGGKTDQVVDQTIHLQTRIAEDGSITNTLTVERTHNGVAGEPFTGADNVNYLRVYVPRGAQLLEASGFSLPSEEHFNAPESWFRSDERVATVEQNGRFDEATGTFISEEFGKTVFAHWTHTSPGQTTLTRFTYRLPFTAFSPSPKKGWFKAALHKLTHAPENVLGYNLYIQRQSGVRQTLVSATTMLPPRWDVAWHTGPATQLSGQVITAAFDPHRDASMAFAATAQH